MSEYDYKGIFAQEVLDAPKSKKRSSQFLVRLIHEDTKEELGRWIVDANSCKDAQRKWREENKEVRVQYKSYCQLGITPLPKNKNQ